MENLTDAVLMENLNVNRTILNTADLANSVRGFAGSWSGVGIGRGVNRLRVCESAIDTLGHVNGAYSTRTNFAFTSSREVGACSSLGFSEAQLVNPQGMSSRKWADVPIQCKPRNAAKNPSWYPSRHVNYVE